MILGREDILKDIEKYERSHQIIKNCFESYAGRPGNFSAESSQRFNKHGSLNGPR
jgi:hypothetical protein